MGQNICRKAIGVYKPSSFPGARVTTWGGEGQGGGHAEQTLLSGLRGNSGTVSIETGGPWALGWGLTGVSREGSVPHAWAWTTM